MPSVVDRIVIMGRITMYGIFGVEGDKKDCYYEERNEFIATEVIICNLTYPENQCYGRYICARSI